MIDRSFGDFGRILRTPDLRIRQVQARIHTAQPPFEHRIEDPSRGVFVYALRGDFTLEVEGSSRPSLSAPQGTAVGFESGRAHRWRTVVASVPDGGPAELFVSSIPRRMGVLQSLEDGFIVVPPDADPFARIIRHAVGIHVCEHLNPSGDGDAAITGRCAEIVLIQFVRFARQKMAAQPDVPAGLVHDEYLLRAWSAFFADPRRRWTVQALADAAGLGRTSFALRFHRVFGTPPLQTLTTLRLEQAEAMLRNTQAPLIEIAFTVGYNSEAAFVRAFHRTYGVPPGRFRHQHSQRHASEPAT